MTLKNEEMVLYPVGSVVAFAGGNLADDGTWLRCDGRSCGIEDYPHLYRVLGDRYGVSDPGTFRIPDYRGDFLRGHREGSLGDQPVERRAYQTGRPKTADLTARFQNIPSQTLKSGDGSRNDGAWTGSFTVTCPYPYDPGGDGDTRPVNVYVERYIRAR